MKKEDQVVQVPVKQIEPWPGLNPRREFPKSELQELATSIKSKGLIQPVTLAPAGEGAKKGIRYWLVAGERRLRAVRLARLAKIRSLISEIDEKTAHRLAGTENLDRSNLTPIEEALWLQKELELTGLTQRKLAAELKRTQPWIANRLRLLELPDVGRALVQEGRVAASSARDLLIGFTKLEQGVQTKVFAAISKALASKNGEPVPLDDARLVIGEALKKAGGLEIDSGYKHLKGVSIEIHAATVAAFVKKHRDRCVRFEGRRHPWSKPPYYTWARKEWNAVVAELVKKAKKRRPRHHSGASSEKAKDPKLGPTKKRTTWESLQDRFGFGSVTELHQVPDLADVDPTHVAVAKRMERDFDPDQDKWITQDRLVLAYVGPDAREYQNGHYDREAEEQRVLTREAAVRALTAADKKVPETSIYRGLLNRLIGDPEEAAEDLVELVRAAGHEVPEGTEDWTVVRYGGVSDARLEDLKLDGFEIRKLAVALAVWDPGVDRREEAAASLRLKAGERIKAWLQEHEIDLKKIPAGIEGVS